MGAIFNRVAFAEIERDVRHHLAALPSRIDSFLEGHILGSRHYVITIGGEEAGFASVHGGSLITQFSLADRWKHVGQPVFRQVRRLEEVQSAFVPTCDEFYLAHALDDYRHLAKQAYFFAYAETPRNDSPGMTGVSLRLAQPDDLPLIAQDSGDFFAPIAPFIAREELFITLRDGEPVGFGLLTPSALYEAVASIGMFTAERSRQQGVGVATIALLIKECQRRGLRPVAGCWYYNHASKRTLERAGMHAGTRLLKIEY